MGCMIQASTGRNTRKHAIGSALRLLRGQLPDPSPEELLWLAVIEHAVRDAYSTKANSDKTREDAIRWLESEYFDGVAIAIGLHPGWAREKIHQIQQISSAEDLLDSDESADDTAYREKVAGNTH